MPRAVERYYGRSAYIGASLMLLAVSLSLPCGVAALGGPRWLGSLLGLAPFVLLVVVTYGRLRDAALSSGWIILLLVAFEVGPSWSGPPPLTLHLGDFVHLIPLILGWTAPGRAVREISSGKVPTTAG